MSATKITWEEHDESFMTECGRFEAMLDRPYGYFSVRRTDAVYPLTPEERAAWEDDVLGEAASLAEASGLVAAYARRYPGLYNET